MAKNRGLGCQRNVLINPEDSNVIVFYGIPRAGMHLWVVRKSRGVAELRYCASTRSLPPARLPAGRFAIQPEQDIIGKIIVLF
jgi:hypothetical protein